MEKSPKLKKCRQCKELFKPFSSTAIVCSIECARQEAVSKREKKERKVWAEKKKSLKTKSEHLEDAQKEFNKFIKLRDREAPCISCGRFHKGQYHAGHYRGVGAYPELRFSEINVNKQCQPCNTHKSGNLIEYRKNLIKKIGAEAVESLEGPHPPTKLTIEDIQAIKKKYKDKLRELENESHN